MCLLISQPIIVNLLKTVVIKSHEFLAIHPKLLTNIQFFDKPKLTSIGYLENDIYQLQINIENNIRSAIIPLKSYCTDFVIHLPLFNTDIQLYIQLV